MKPHDDGESVLIYAYNSELSPSRSPQLKAAAALKAASPSDPEAPLSYVTSPNLGHLPLPTRRPSRCPYVGALAGTQDRMRAYLQGGILERHVFWYLLGRLSLRELEEWFVPWWWDRPPQAVERKVAGLLAGAEELTEDQLRHELRNAVSTTHSLGVVKWRE